MEDKIYEYNNKQDALFIALGGLPMLLIVYFTCLNKPYAVVVGLNLLVWFPFILKLIFSKTRDDKVNARMIYSVILLIFNVAALGFHLITGFYEKPSTGKEIVTLIEGKGLTRYAPPLLENTAGEIRITLIVYAVLFMISLISFIIVAPKYKKLKNKVAL